MSLSGQYLEELSRRYKKQEELSRALNKTLVLLREEIRKSKDREQQRDSDLLFLRTQLIQLTATIDSYQSERDSWQNKAVVSNNTCYHNLYFLLFDSTFIPPIMTFYCISCISTGAKPAFCANCHRSSHVWSCHMDVSPAPIRPWSCHLCWTSTQVEYWLAKV